MHNTHETDENPDGDEPTFNVTLKQPEDSLFVQ